jgi:putative membrane protein
LPAMYVKKNFNFTSLMKFSGWHLIWITIWSTFATCFIETLHFFNYNGFHVPWLPISVVGTAVAFYVGFKNNSAYDRLWEARKIWGAVVNSSRMWGTNVRAYVTNTFRDQNLSEMELKQIQKRLVYRHIGWLYALRSQLLISTEWEHINQNSHIKKATKMRQLKYGVGLYADEITKIELSEFLPVEEHDTLIDYKNTATQIIDYQSQNLKHLREENLIDDFRHMDLQKILNDLYVHQGQAERIKKFPLPRQYASLSLIFIGIFIFLLPFGMVTEFHKLGDWGAWLSIPFSVVVCWVFLMMELIGDYSENPFEGLGNDIPMLSLCRTIEIDLKEMLGEENIPEAINPVDGVLM